jgi:hypothetical protein
MGVDAKRAYIFLIPIDGYLLGMEIDINASCMRINSG